MDRKVLAALIVAILCIAGIGGALAYTAMITNTGNNSGTDGMVINFYKDNRGLVPIGNGEVLGNISLDSETTMDETGTLVTKWYFGKDTDLLENETYIRSTDTDDTNVNGAVRITISGATFPTEISEDSEKATFLTTYFEAKLYKDPTAPTPEEATGLFTCAGDKIIIDFTTDSTATSDVKYNTVSIGGKENKLTINIKSSFIGQEATEFIGFKIVNSDVTAKFDTNTYELRYDTSPGAYAPCNLGELRKVKTAPVSPEGKVFVHWNTASDDSGTAYEPGDTIKVESDITLYAIWQNSP